MNKEQYESNYPNYCRTCSGKGVLNSSAPFFNDCKDCLEKKHCPQCGEYAPVDTCICAKCGWNRDDQDRGLPLG